MKYFVQIVFLLLVPKIGFSSSIFSIPNCSILTGHIGEFPAQICFKIDSQNKVAAEYFYFKYNKKISLKGAYDKKKNKLSFDEYSDNKKNLKPTATWSGDYDSKNNVYTGEFRQKNKEWVLPFKFYNIEDVNIKTERKSFTKLNCKHVEGDFPLYSADWDHLISSDNNMADEINSVITRFIESAMGVGDLDQNYSASAADIEKGCSGEKLSYSDTFTVNASIKQIGKYIVEMELKTSGYRDVVSLTKFFDLRTGTTFEFENFFTDSGKKNLINSIEKHLKDLEMSDCNVGFNEVSSFSQCFSTQFQVEQSKKSDTSSKGVISGPFGDWCIYFASNTFNCMGHRGYSFELNKLSQSFLKDGLNPLYFNPSTNFFY